MSKDTLNCEDIIYSKSGNIDIILNEYYSNLVYIVNSYYASLLLDIKLNEEIGYSQYHGLIQDFIAQEIYSENIKDSVIKSENEIQYLMSLILTKKDGDILEVFFKNTSQKYEEVEMELRIYVDFIHYTLALKIG